MRSFVVGFLAAACAGGPDYPTTDAACDAAGERIRELDCRRPDGGPAWKTPQGDSFASACKYAERDGRRWHADCIAEMASCSELESRFEGALCR